jgi:hypothetical protein
MNLGKQLKAMALHLGQEQGLPKKLKLVVTEGARGSICLTTTGWDFAQVQSQFLDHGGESLELSSEERNILATHIGKYVPSERRAIRSILYQLHDGHHTAMEIERGLIRAGQLDGLEEELKYSSSFVVIQQLHYLGLLAKAGTRTKALFSNTEDGRKYLEQFPGKIRR